MGYVFNNVKSAGLEPEGNKHDSSCPFSPLVQTVQEQRERQNFGARSWSQGAPVGVRKRDGIA